MIVLTCGGSARPVCPGSVNRGTAVFQSVEKHEATQAIICTILSASNTSLPTYDEAEKAKAAAMATSTVEVMPRDDEFPPRDDFSDADQLRVGNDGIFMLAFFMAFLFNWIGFCLSFCLTNTIAGRYGAICGFGLSLIKWILIVRFSDYFTGYFNGQYWLWWIFLLLGLLLFFRGFVNYLKVRNMSENMATSHRTRLFFLY